MEVEPSQRLLDLVLAGFRLQRTTFNAWCRDHDISRVFCRQAVVGERNGPAAQELRRQVCEAAGAARLEEVAGNRGGVKGGRDSETKVSGDEEFDPRQLRLPLGGNA